MVVMEDVTEEERSAELYVSVHGGLDHTFLKRGAELSPFQTNTAKSYLMLPLSPEKFWFVCLIYMLEIRYERRCEPLHMKYGSLSAPKAFFYPKMATNECNSKLNPDFLITLAQIGRYCFV